MPCFNCYLVSDMYLKAWGLVSQTVVQFVITQNCIWTQFEDASQLTLMFQAAIFVLCQMGRLLTANIWLLGVWCDNVTNDTHKSSHLNIRLRGWVYSFIQLKLDSTGNIRKQMCPIFSVMDCKRLCPTQVSANQHVNTK